MMWGQNLLTMTGLGLMAMHHYEGWMASQWIGMAPEDQDAEIERLEEAVAEIAKVQMEKWEGMEMEKGEKKEEAKVKVKAKAKKPQKAKVKKAPKEKKARLMRVHEHLPSFYLL